VGVGKPPTINPFIATRQMFPCPLSAKLFIESETEMNQNRITYEIIVKETLATRWSEWFEGCCLEKLDSGSTRISGALLDHAALHGLLERVRDLNLSLVSVQVQDIPPKG
jgi:hypothetical protein